MYPNYNICYETLCENNVIFFANESMGVDDDLVSKGKFVFEREKDDHVR